MGSYLPSFFANLFFIFMRANGKKMKNTDIRRANTFRFIVDLTVLNDGDEFERSFSEFYSPELELKKENGINTVGSYLDLEH